MVDAGDSKSPALTGVPVRVRPWVPTYTVSFREFSIKTSKTRVLAFLRGCFTRLFTGLFGIILGILTQHCFGWKSLRRFLTETSQTVFDSSETDIRFLAKQPLMIYNKNQPMGLSMSKTSFHSTFIGHLLGSTVCVGTSRKTSWKCRVASSGTRCWATISKMRCVLTQQPCWSLTALLPPLTI